MNKSLVRRFCTPPLPALTDYDARVLADSEKTAFAFEGGFLQGYCWGEGKTILLVHGWGSRASHLGHIGRLLSKVGFRVVAFDAPAHSSSSVTPRKEASNMFEYCRAISAVAQTTGPLHAAIGHSFGAITALFAAAGLSVFRDYRITVDFLVLVSMPRNVAMVLDSFCRRNELASAQRAELQESLEEEFAFAVDDYSADLALQGLAGEVLLVHDENDEEFPITSIRSLHAAFPKTQLFATSGAGHQKILMIRAMMGCIREFLRPS